MSERGESFLYIITPGKLGLRIFLRKVKTLLTTFFLHFIILQMICNSEIDKWACI